MALTDRPHNMLVLDIDGVITEPDSGEVSGEVLAAVSADLKRGLPVAFNTGRGLGWIEQNILPILMHDCRPDDLDHLLLSGEKGGALATIEQGKLRSSIDSTLTPPPAFVEAAQALLAADQGGWKLADTIRWDGSKKTMITYQRRPEAPLEHYTLASKTLAASLARLIREYNLSDFRIDPTVTALDVEHNQAGKHSGARAILNWLKERGSLPQEFTAIGDSPSDAVMADILATAAPTTFVYVGDPANYSRPQDAPYQAIITGGGYSRDAAVYLKMLT